MNTSIADVVPQDRRLITDYVGAMQKEKSPSDMFCNVSDELLVWAPLSPKKALD